MYLKAQGHGLPCRGLLLLLLAVLLQQAPVPSLAREASAQSQAKAADTEANKAKSLVLFLSLDDPSDEVKLALEALGLPLRHHKSQTVFKA